MPSLNIAWGENPVVLLCDDPLKAAPCKETFVPRMRLAAAVTFPANVVHLHAVRKLSVIFIGGPGCIDILCNVLLDVERTVSCPITCVQIGFVPNFNRLQCDIRVLESGRGKRIGDGARLKESGGEIVFAKVYPPYDLCV
jgi:hypothetical protein